ncbi:hypothetical protein HDV05_007660 [Chytridiales sp. JEL 0842]|nr:hypothetical protein HDV05_007660 [Chytridiales sp. JEL 0842]
MFDTELQFKKTQLKSIVMINCGGFLDLDDFFSLPESCIVYVVDSHRPFNLDNLFGKENIVVLDDGEVDDMKDIQEAYTSMEFDSSSDEDGEGSDSGSGSDSEADDLDKDGDDEDDDEEKENDSDDGSDDDVEDSETVLGDEDAQGEAGPSRKRKKSKSKKPKDDLEEARSKRRSSMIKKRKKRENQRLIAEYYAGGTYYGTAASEMMYTLASQVGKASADLLWFAIIGLSEQYLHDRIDYRKYKAEVNTLKTEVARFDLSGGVANGGADELRRREGGDDEDEEDDDDDGRGGVRGGVARGGMATAAAGSQNGTVGPNTFSGVRGADDRNIKVAEEFRLMLVRHWNFYDAMYHSNYVATRLGIWKEKGRQRLTNLLVKMGFPLKQCQQPYIEIKLDLKKAIRSKLLQVAPAFNMTEIVFPSFLRHFGYKCTISASDAVYGITALLDHGADWMRKHVGGTSDSIETSASTTSGPTGPSIDGSKSGLGTGTHPHDDPTAAASTLSSVGVGMRQGVSALTARLSEFDTGLSEHLILHEGPEGPVALYEDDEPPLPDEDEQATREREARNKRRKREREWIKNFYLAYDALEEVDVLYHGIHLGMNFQRALVRTGVAVIDKQMTKTLRNFRLTVLSGGGGDGENEFSVFGRSVGLLARLALFLMDAFKEHRRRQKDLPLVVAALNEENDSYLVLGKPAISKAGDIRKNPFGLAFHAAAQRTGARVKHDHFETAVAEVQRDDLIPFIENLQFSL